MVIGNINIVATAHPNIIKCFQIIIRNIINFDIGYEETNKL